MAQTRFSGPVKSDNGFEGNVIGNITGNIASTTASIGTLTVTASAIIGDAATDTVAFYGATPTARYNTTGTVTGFTAGSGTGVNDDSTFTGNTGSTAYTVGDVVRALKQLGVIAP
jgi:hypothetical protein